MSIRTGLDFEAEMVFLELGGNAGVKTTVTMPVKVARALAAQILANAKALDVALISGLLGNDDD